MSTPTFSFSATIATAVAAIAFSSTDAAATVLYTQGNLIAPAETTRFVTLAVDETIHRPPTGLLTWGSYKMQGGLSIRNVELDSPPDFDAYALIGIDSTGGVFVTFADPSAAFGRSFSTVFPGFDEALVADAIRTDNQLLVKFMQQLDVTPGVKKGIGGPPECAICHFSDGAPYGTFIASFSPVPAPGAAMTFALTGLSSLGRRRRIRD